MDQALTVGSGSIVTNYKICREKNSNNSQRSPLCWYYTKVRPFLKKIDKNSKTFKRNKIQKYKKKNLRTLANVLLTREKLFNKDFTMKIIHCQLFERRYCCSVLLTSYNISCIIDHPFPVPLKLLIRERNSQSMLKISLEAWKERRLLKSGKRDGSSKHRTETTIREYKNP